ncbi:DUF2249 domain-containing protein [Schaalia sp. lx-260]|uniref:DUF2249 domain-containing protein n=1 Tax=Schaalia sp. lx-260 TaxID=2899082 RepID=UPI001E395288|nr:DUF2249 domain-containing protein [Schaalia sp. lx-260]MCD4550052.1 DUF2249 domain-containing protein [Schaalia sp. lx-260]
MNETHPDVTPHDDRQMFRLVDSRVSARPAGSGCGCGGHGHEQASHLQEATGGPELARHRGGKGCGCGGHAHTSHTADAATPAEKPQHGSHGGCGCGGHGRGHRAEQGTQTEELLVHSWPRSVRKAMIFAAVDTLPAGENLVIVTPHQPESIFDHLQASDNHYRVETLQSGPDQWRYRITRIS